MSLIQKPCTVSMMLYFNHILVIALKYGEILIKTISTKYFFYKKVMQIVCHPRSLGHTSQILSKLGILKIFDLNGFKNVFLCAKFFTN